MVEIQKHLEVRCPDDVKKAENQRSAVEIAQAAIQSNNTMLEDLFQQFLIVNAIIVGVTFISRFIPQARPLIIAANIARQNVAQTMTRIQVQKAANDRTYQVLELLKRAA